MNIAIWVVQIILSIKAISVTYSHGLRQDQTEMRQSIQKMGAKSRPLLVTIAVISFLGCVGLLIPGVFGFQTWITPIAAVLLSLMMLLSMAFHTKYRETPNIFVSVILFLLAVFVAYGRWVLSPL